MKMSIFFCGFNMRPLVLPESFALQCTPKESKLGVHTVEESGEVGVDDVLFSREAFFWSSGSAWRTSSEFPKCELEGVEKVFPSSHGLAAISKDGRVCLWNMERWLTLSISFPAPKYCTENAASNRSFLPPATSDAASNRSFLPPATSDAAITESKILKSDGDSSILTLPSFGKVSIQSDSNSGSLRAAKTKCRHGIEQIPCTGRHLNHAEHNFVDRNSDSVTKAPFTDVRVIGKRILLLDEAGDVWQGDLPSAPQCRLQALLLGRSVAEVAVGAQHCLLRTAQDQVFTFGCGMRGELGAGEVKHRELPVAVPLLEGVPIKKVVAGAWHCLAQGRLGEVYVWGWNVHGQLGLPCKAGDNSASLYGCDARPQFRPCSCHAPNETGVSQKSLISTSKSCLQDTRTENSLKDHDYENSSSVEKNTKQPPHLGINSKISSSGESLEDKEAIVNVQSTPVMLEAFGDRDVVDIAAGDQHSLFLLEDGSVWSCGWNKYGQCGVCWRGGEKRPLSPIPDLPPVRRVWAGCWCSAFLPALPT